MKGRKLSRRDILKGSASARRSAAVFASPVRAAGAGAGRDHAGADRAAKKEGKVIFYSSMDLPVGEKLGKAFEAAYPGITVQIERSGSERLFQRIDQEFASNIRAADIINTSDASHFITWKKNGWLAPFVPEDVAKYFPAEYRDPDGMSATSRDLSVVDRLQHQSGEARGRAEELCRPARSQMGRQDGQGPSRPIAAPS